MAFDIYGNYLRPGYCEVHPDVREGYPCRQCVDDETQHEAERQAYEDAMREQYVQEMLTQMEGDTNGC